MKTQILADTGLRNDFSRCVVLYKDYIAQNIANRNPYLNLLAVRIEREGGKDNKRNAAMGVVVEDRYDMTKEYWALSNEQKLRLNELHGGKGHQPSKRQCLDRKTSLKSQVAAIACPLSVLQAIETRGKLPVNMMAIMPSPTSRLKAMARPSGTAG